MEIRLYVGAHRTASQHMAAVLQKNHDFLLDQGTLHSVPNNRRIIKRLSNAAKSISNGADIETISENLINRCTNGEKVKRIVIINPDILGSISRPFGKELFYPRTRSFVKQLQTLFAGHDMRLFLSIRNPSTFLPSCYADALLNERFTSYEDFLTEVNIESLRWSSFLHRAQDKQAQTPITTWRFEDYPYIWRDIAKAITGISNTQDIEDIPERPNSGLTINGTKKLFDYIEKHPENLKKRFNQIRKVFHEQFPSSPNELIGPNWPPDLIQRLTDMYEDDWYYIERMDNVETVQRRIYE